MSDQVEMLKLNDFIKTAAEEDIESAVAKFGQGLPHAEIEAFKQLSNDEIKALYDVNKKITDLSGFDPNDQAWVCGALC